LQVSSHGLLLVDIAPITQTPTPSHSDYLSLRRQIAFAHRSDTFIEKLVSAGGLIALVPLMKERDEWFAKVAAVLAAALSRPALSAAAVRDAGLAALLDVVRLASGVLVFP
jgi:hypothetical protein